MTALSARSCSVQLNESCSFLCTTLEQLGSAGGDDAKSVPQTKSCLDGKYVLPDVSRATSAGAAEAVGARAPDSCLASCACKAAYERKQQLQN